jgi:hypothetical protein
MEYSTLQPWQEVGETGIVYDKGSLYGRFIGIGDPRGFKGRRYSLEMLLVIIFLAKLAGKDKPDEIADWAKNDAEELAQLLGLTRVWMPSHSTIRRVFHRILDEGEFDRMAQEYQQQEQGGGGEVLALDGKVLHGTQIAGVEDSDNVLSIYAVEEQAVLAQQAVDSKENEIVAAPQVLKRVTLAGKIVTADALHTQRATSQQIVTDGGDYVWPVKENQPRLYTDIQRLALAPSKPIS